MRYNYLFYLASFFASVSCNSSFETKLIDEPLLSNNTTDVVLAEEKILLSSMVLKNAWLLDTKTQRKVSSVKKYENVEVLEEVNNYFIITHRDKELLIEKANVEKGLQSRVVLNQVSLYSEPDLTKQIDDKYAPGTLIIVSNDDLGDFYKVKTDLKNSWLFVLKSQVDFSPNPSDIDFAFQIKEIKESKVDDLVKENLYKELKENTDFQYPDWLPKIELIKDEEISEDFL